MIHILKIVPLGKTPIPDSMLERIKNNIKKTFVTKVEINQTIDLPDYTFNHLRNQYRSDVLLEFLGKTFKGENVIGITAEDLYTSKLNFVFGQAKIKKGIAIVSVHRLDSEFYKKLRDERLWENRAIKEVIHELGHSVHGLLHCKDPECVMSFSNTIADVDRKKKSLCEMCKLQIGM